ncbi:MAG: triple tyrosine motif-containing protein [Saprospiraceae bacterium]
MNKLKILITVFCFCLSQNIKSQDYNLGVPIIQAFPKEVSQSGSQNWDMIQDNLGIMYFANNDGLLVFDGTTWTIYPLPNFTIVRSLAIDESGIIYAGGQNEFGRYIPNAIGEWQFESLKHLIPKNFQNFEDVWGIEITSDGIFFMASEKLFHLKEGKVSVYTQGTINFISQINNKIYVQDYQSGLYSFSAGKLNKVSGSDFFTGKAIAAVVKTGNKDILGTAHDGFFEMTNDGFERWETDADDFLRANHIKNVTNIVGNRIVVATVYGGLLFFNQKGQHLFHLHKGNGLLNNNILTLFSDKSQNLWVGLSNGLNYIHTNSPFTRIFPDEELDAVGFVTKIHQNKIYFGTNKGLYVGNWKQQYSPLESIDFQLVENTKGQVWGLDIVDNQLVIAHVNGAMKVKNGIAEPFFNKTGIWNFKQLNHHPELRIAGGYFNIFLFGKENDTYKILPDFTQLNESSRFVEEDQKGNIWMSHPYRGIFKITPNNTFTESKIELLGKDQGLPSYLLNHLFKINNELIFCGESGAFTYNYETERFEEYPIFNDIFGKRNKIRRLIEAPDRNIWFVTQDEFGILEVDDKGLEKKINKIVFPFFKKELNQGFESIYPYDDKNVFISNDRGFIHYHPIDYLSSDTTFQVIINEIKITSQKDSIISKGLFFNENVVSNVQLDQNIENFSHDLNDFYFSFSATDFVSGEATEFRYYLEGYDKDWTDWNYHKSKEYTNLGPGNYVFHLQGKNNFQTESKVLTYEFTIVPPWYASTLAYLIYSLISLVCLSSIIRVYQKKYSGLKEENKLVVQESEIAIGKLKAEKTELELASKKRELVSTTLNLVKKNETITQIKERLIEIKKQATDSTLNQKIQKLIQKLQQEEIQDEGWEQVMFHFNQLHREFFERLKRNYPKLTPKDLKMCAYLRMNLSTKEMTSLLNVTTRGVEASRYRLRKKFELTKEENLTEFLMQF